MTFYFKLLVKYKSSLSSDKVASSESGEKRAHKHCLQEKTVLKSSEIICGWVLMWEDNKETDLGGSIIMDYGLFWLRSDG